ncbi:hypothetical protein TNCV_3747251 [Trichonephila clavipes]|nr:hypothetical protein TNCV_3747251 [Trichonephila clavipes]
MCGPRDYNVFPKWPAKSFGLDTPDLKHVREEFSLANEFKPESRGKDNRNLTSKNLSIILDNILLLALTKYDGCFVPVGRSWQTKTYSNVLVATMLRIRVLVLLKTRCVEVTLNLPWLNVLLLVLEGCRRWT